MTEQQQIEITALIDKAGSERKAAAVILAVRAFAPNQSSLSRAKKGQGNDYVVQCYIDDLKYRNSKTIRNYKKPSAEKRRVDPSLVVS